ncbi:MAG: diacylglycerol kinase (ATP) [Flavobacteriales bacterium]|jgi:diacylglycerol kinase (ATP)
MKRLLRSFKYAGKGLITYLKSGGNVPVHLISYGILLTLGFYLGVSKLEWCVLHICVAMVFSAEAFNTAIEEIVNFVSPSLNVKAGEIKDISAAAVLITAIFSCIIALIIFLPYFKQ